MKIETPEELWQYLHEMLHITMPLDEFISFWTDDRFVKTFHRKGGAWQLGKSTIGLWTDLVRTKNGRLAIYCPDDFLAEGGLKLMDEMNAVLQETTL